MGCLENDIDYAIQIHNAALSKCDEVMKDVRKELDKAMRKFPTWPNDPFHALTVLGEEYGELNKALLQSVYETDKADNENIREEAIQTAAMAIRFIVSIDRYRIESIVQHDQGHD